MGSERSASSDSQVTWQQAALAESQNELRRVQDESREFKEQLANGADLHPLLEKVIYQDRCEQLKQSLEKAEMEESAKVQQIQSLLVENATYKEALSAAGAATRSPTCHACCE
ncbi:unnamed protein product [Symbiodinium natans]|uniref:Uncharacterized protein n=1 Tax=Symbiodinium natans TaxID=878477 RepID=A0A812IQ99_9DINO|nr:unnamed protein product [Symbiodinium natans]